MVMACLEDEGHAKNQLIVLEVSISSRTSKILLQLCPFQTLLFAGNGVGEVEVVIN